MTEEQKEKRRQYHKEYYARNKEELLAKNNVYRNTYKGQPKYTEEERIERRKTKGERQKKNVAKYYREHKEQIADWNKEYQKEYQAKNKEEINKKAKLRREENIDKDRKRNLDYYYKNKDEIKEKNKKNKLKKQEYLKIYREENKDKIKALKHEDYLKNKDKYREQKQLYNKTNRDKINEKRREKMATDVAFRISCQLRGRLRHAIRNKSKKGSAVRDLGCTIEEFIIYIENLFEEGMTWENYSHSGWHIDHIKPLSWFDLENREEFLEAVHYTNLQPLWAKDNLSKGNRYSGKPKSQSIENIEF